MQKSEDLKNVAPAAVFTCGFDPLRDVGVEYGTKLKQAGNEVAWHRFDTLTNGFLQMAQWSDKAMKTTKMVGREPKGLGYGN
jgi:acetyl esterase/lipase